MTSFFDRKTGKIHDFAIFTVFWSKRGQISSDLNSETSFGMIPQHSNPNMQGFAHYDFLVSNSNFQNVNQNGADQTEHFWENKLYHSEQREKNAPQKRGTSENFNKLKCDEPYYS